MEEFNVFSEGSSVGGSHLRVHDFVSAPRYRVRYYTQLVRIDCPGRSHSQLDEPLHFTFSRIHSEGSFDEVRKPIRENAHSPLEYDYMYYLNISYNRRVHANFRLHLPKL